MVGWVELGGSLSPTHSSRHSSPHCWRCDSPLLNYATGSWFVQVEKIKEDMLASNAKTEWVPSHLRDGRFGKWLEGARDWAISRNRYWGTPLPVWRTADKRETDVLGSRDDLLARHRIRFTKVTAVRHGEGEHNLKNIYQGIAPGANLTKRGKTQAEAAGEHLRTQNVAIIYCSPLARTRQTAEAIAKATGAEIVVDERLREVEFGEFEGKGFDWNDLTFVKSRRLHKIERNSPENIYHMPGMETWSSVSARMHAFLEEILPRHRSEHVVVVTHADPVNHIRQFFTKIDAWKLSHQPFPGLAEPVSFFFDHARSAELDLHKDIIDPVRWAGGIADTSVRAVVARHGETEWNHAGKIQGGNGDVPLNDTGRSQAKELAQSLKGQSFDAIVSSDLSRSIETARIVADALGVPHVGQWESLRERHLGEWSGALVDDVKQLLPSSDPLTPLHFATPPGGETLSAFLQRLEGAYRQLLLEFPGKRILIVGHRGTVLGLSTLARNLAYREAISIDIPNAKTVELSLNPQLERIPDVLDCWFESGSMPYAQSHFPFASHHSQSPLGFPADFIAEGIDQTRGWFYTLTVLSSALFQKPAFKHCIVNGTVLAEDGRKMSKRLKNYPDPNEVIERHGADALRFALMSSPAVRAEDLRFSEKMVEEVVRSVLLPLWNSYSFFVTYANAAKFEPVARPHGSSHPLDLWIKAEVQDLVNRMTKQLDGYDLSATCAELHETIDALTNWYIRLSRRRFAGKGQSDAPEGLPESFDEDAHQALTTLYDVLITLSQVLAPFCPFVTEQIYLNLVPEENGSVHLTDWPQTRVLTKGEKALLQKNRILRTIVSLGNSLRSEKRIKVRQPLATVTIALPLAVFDASLFEAEDLQLLCQELNVKHVDFVSDPGSLGRPIVQVNARVAGPRLGSRVQQIIAAGKLGEFEVAPDGAILIQDERLTSDEAQIVYQGSEGKDIAADGGIVVGLDTTVTPELRQEGRARDVTRAIQRLRKDEGFTMGETIVIGLEGIDDLLLHHKALIERETNVTIASVTGTTHQVDLGDDLSVTIPLPSRAL